MKAKLMVFLILGLLIFPAVAQADGDDRGFLFPGLAAIRANQQSRAFQAQANLNIAKANAQITKANAQAAVVLRSQVRHGGDVQFILKNQRHFVPRNIVIAATAPQYVVQSPQFVVQSPQFVVQAASPCNQVAAPAFVPAASSFFSVQSFASGGGCYAGF